MFFIRKHWSLLHPQDFREGIINWRHISDYRLLIWRWHIHIWETKARNLLEQQNPLGKKYESMSNTANSQSASSPFCIQQIGWPLVFPLLRMPVRDSSVALDLYPLHIYQIRSAKVHQDIWNAPSYRHMGIQKPLKVLSWKILDELERKQEV